MNDAPPIGLAAQSPGLLVSVRSLPEALEAVAGGATVVDLKEPDRGPLGPCDPSVWASIAAALPPEIPLSAALGEADDWLRGRSPTPELTSEAFRSLRFVKLGPAGLAAYPDGINAWKSALDLFPAALPWIAVAYADHEAAQSPNPEVMARAVADDSRIVGLLIDTWDKSGPGLLHYGQFLNEWLAPLRGNSKLIALAGRLDALTFPSLRIHRPHLLGVRGAACQDGSRSGSVSRDRVAALVEAMKAHEYRTMADSQRLAECSHSVNST